MKDTAHPAMFDEPTYFTFCTLKETDVPPTGIENVQRSTLIVQRSMFNVQRDAWYTLDGRRVNAENLRPGLYINNGKKVLKK